jgi:hypothetical protein
MTQRISRLAKAKDLPNFKEIAIELGVQTQIGKKRFPFVIALLREICTMLPEHFPDITT